MQYTVKPYNPEAKLISQDYETKSGAVELVVSENNDGTNKRLEAYFYDDNVLKFGHHYSRSWPLDQAPAKYKDAILQLQLWLVHCPAGHKLTLA